MSRTAHITAAACLMLVTACGTTVPLTTQSTVGGGSDFGASGGSTAGSSGGSGVTPTPGTGLGSTSGSSSSGLGGATGGTTSGVTSGGTSGAASGAGATGSTGSAAAIPATGRGWDRTTVYLGLMVASDADTALRAAGINLDPGDPAGDARAVADAINRRGGLFGRKVQVVVHDNRSAEIAANPANAAAENCTYFTQDRPVLGVLNTVSVLDLDNLRACLAKGQTPLFTLSTTPFDDKLQHATAPYYYNGVSVSWTPLIPLLVKRLQSQQYLTPWNTMNGSASSTGGAKVGILYGNDEAGRRVGPALAAQFKAAGYETVTFQWSQTSDATAAELSFAQNRVTHVVSIDNFLFFFATAAGAQAYYPRYAVNTYNGIQVLLEANTPKRLLAGAKGIGWYPALDVTAPYDVKGPGTTGCLKDLAAGGQTFSGRRFAEAVARSLCDGVGLAVMGAKAGGGLDAAAVRLGVLRLGADFPISGGTKSGLSQTQFGVPGEVRDLSFDASCACFKYTSKGFAL